MKNTVFLKSCNKWEAYSNLGLARVKGDEVKKMINNI